MTPLSCLLIGAALARPEGWDIQAPHGPTHTWSAELSEGTWISIDVHPDGTQLVFDLLGDLYLLPFEGGRARRITLGTAWDQDPRWSPDGRSLLYVSDRGGNQEIWIRDLDEGEDRVLTEGRPERFSEAAWSPDGRTIVARKRVTDTRSIGMCELWLFDVEGGDGVQLTDTDAHPFPVEPAFSVDGRYLYFSSTPARFQYDRDPNHGIYDLHRLDLESGEALRLTAEAGSAFRPSVNPVTAEVALMRRRGSSTALEIYDPEDGSRRLIADGFERDNQEGFALNGLYPHASWTPDGTELVLWDDGQIVRVDARTGRRTPIPFTAKVRHVLTEPVRHPRRAGLGAEVVARAVRWPVVSPDGSAVVFEAFGRLWRQAVGSDPATPLTDGTRRALAPTWSPDGRSIAYATWHDEEQGDVRVLDLATGSERMLTGARAQYLSPSWSPDGSQLAWWKGSGAPLRGHDTSAELWFQLEVAGVDGGPVIPVLRRSWNSGARRVQRPGWVPDGTRLLLTEHEPAEQPWMAPTSVLQVVTFGGHVERVVARWQKALEVAVSPSGEAVAWVEDHKVWRAPLPWTASVPLELGPESQPVPVTPVSEEAGTWLSWTGDTLTWTTGPELTIGEQEVRLEARLPRPNPTGQWAYVNVRAITMGPEGVIEGATVIVDGDRIVSVGTAPPPEDLRTVDARGRTLVPGLIDVHAHLHYGASDAHPQRSWRHEITLAYGVTTVHDPSAPDDVVFGSAERIAAGLERGPRVYSTGSVIYGAKARGRSRVDTLDDAYFHVRRMAAMGAISVKNYQQPGRDQRQWLVQAAREEGLNIYPEGGGDLFMNLAMLGDGHTGIEHALPVAPLYADVIGFYAATGAGYSPTLLVAYGGPSGERYFYGTEELLGDEKFLRFTPSEVVDRVARRTPAQVRDGDWHHKSVARTAAELQQAGVPVVLGAHGQLQGLGPHWELWALGEGLGAEGALRAATIDAAWYLGLERDLGSLEGRKLADMVLLEGNPLHDLRATLEIVEVVQGGVRYDGASLDRLN